MQPYRAPPAALALPATQARPVARSGFVALCTTVVLAIGGTFLLAGLLFGDGIEVAFGLLLIFWALLSR